MLLWSEVVFNQQLLHKILRQVSSDFVRQWSSQWLLYVQ